MSYDDEPRPGALYAADLLAEPAPAVPPHEYVLTIEPVNDVIRDYFRLSRDARQALFEHFDGHAEVLTTDDQCPFGILHAARAYAESMGAVFTEEAA